MVIRLKYRGSQILTEKNMPSVLEVIDLHVSVDSKPILNGVNLSIKQGETHAVMGPNGSGKSTLSFTLMGHPRYIIDSGDVLFDGESILKIPTEKRAKMGLFLAFQYPHEVQGVSVFNFLRTAYNAVNSDKGNGTSTEGKSNENATVEKKKPISVIAFRKYLREKMQLLDVKEEFVKRYLNEGFSGGEKKKSEILQLAVLQPKIAIMDETDSGLDIDALKVVSEAVNKMSGPDLGILLITHYQRILKYINPQHVHVLMNGRIVKSGGSDLAEQLEKRGYDWVRDEVSN